MCYNSSNEAMHKVAAVVTNSNVLAIGVFLVYLDRATHDSRIDTDTHDYLLMCNTRSIDSNQCPPKFNKL